MTVHMLDLNTPSLSKGTRQRLVWAYYPHGRRSSRQWEVVTKQILEEIGPRAISVRPLYPCSRRLGLRGIQRISPHSLWIPRLLDFSDRGTAVRSRP